MKRIIFIFCLCLSGMYLWAQEDEPGSAPGQKFKPHYAGASVDAGVMFTPDFGSAFYLAPKITFQATPRFFLHTGIGLMQYSLLPSQMNDLSPQWAATSAYIFADGVYLLNERWSVNGSVMKNISSGPLRQVNPYAMPSEAVHFGVDYKLTPNITIGARVGYSNGGHSRGMYHPFFPY